MPPIAAEGICGLNPPHGHASDSCAPVQLDVSLSEKFTWKMDNMLSVHFEKNIY